MKVFGKWLIVQDTEGKRCIVTSGRTKRELVGYLDSRSGLHRVQSASNNTYIDKWVDSVGNTFSVKKNTKEYR